MTLQGEFAATLIDEFASGGVRDAVCSPGSRSSPLAIALLDQSEIALHFRLDERSACFYALGLAMASGRPTLVVTTSGTAAAELHAGVVEADLAGVPLIVLSADRPPELYGVGAAQTIDQTRLYGVSVRYAADLGVPDPSTRPYWRSHASRLLAEACAGPGGPGPVHANLPFREPLPSSPEVALASPRGATPWHDVVRGPAVAPLALERFLEIIGHARRGLVLVGGGVEDGEALVDLAEALGWPLLGDARFGRPLRDPVVAHADGILRAGGLESVLEPDLLLQVGTPHASRVVEAWLARLGTREVQRVVLDPFGRFGEPSRARSVVLGASPGALARAALGAGGLPRAVPQWAGMWRAADDAAEQAIAVELSASAVPSEPFVARRILELAPLGATVFGSSSMPIRDLEWFGPRLAEPPRVLANRGANGIDGVTSTLLGVAAAEHAEHRGPVLGLIGDLALLHDLSGLVWGRHEQAPPAVIVLVDNSGGGIFNFLGYADDLGSEAFERGFGTPQVVDFEALGAALGVAVHTVSSTAEFDAALEEAIADDAFRIVRVVTDRPENVALHRRLNAAVVQAVLEATQVAPRR